MVNNGFYGGYNPYAYVDNATMLRNQQMPPMQDNLSMLKNNQMQQQTGDNRIWVQGEIGAKSYMVAPGNTVDLWDSESQSIFLKSVNQFGVPSMQRISYSFEVHEEQKKQEYITREEFENRLKELGNVRKSDADDADV